MNFVSYETALRLKEAGFPQPELNHVLGHIFYDRLGRKYMAVWQDDEDSNILMQPHLHNYSDLKNPMVFAPTATDILRELPDGYYLSKDENEFICDCMDDWAEPAHEYSLRSDNPTEACAAAWLAIHEKK